MTRFSLLIMAILAVGMGYPAGAGTHVLPSLATDQADYSPGSRASVSGTGFRPGETIRLQVLQINTADNKGPEHQPWKIKADPTGGFKDIWPVATHEAGATLRLTAAGLSSGWMAEKIFTDAAITPASGGGAISANSYNSAFTVLTGPVIVETVIGDINTGTLVLTAPAGFIFDTNAPLPIIALSGDNNNKNINDLTDGSVIALAVTANSLSFTVNTKSKGQTKNTLTYSNVRVRPTAATPLASGNITNTGTSIFPNSTINFGTLTEVAGLSAQLTVSGFPSPQIAGVAGSMAVAARDQFGNVVSNYSGTVHLSSSDPLAILPADYTFVAGDNGTHSFSNAVTLKTIGSQSITASNMAAASFTGIQSGISVSPAPADHLAFATQPGSATYGSALSSQPVIVSVDRFGNNSTVGIGASKIVTLSLSSGSGVLTGTSSLDLGSAAGNGTVTFANLAVNAAGSGKQLTASGGGLTNALSSTFTINQATLIASVTVSNKVYDGSTGAAVATRALSGVHATDTVTLSGGTAAFGTKTAGNGKNVTVSGLALSGANASNYALASTSASNTANITPAALMITGATAGNKVYDGTTAAAVSGGSLAGLMSGDSVTLGGTPSGSFASKTVSNNKPLTASGYAISGLDSGNYTLVQPTGLTANIAAAGLTVSGLTASNKIYDGNTSAIVNAGSAALVGVVSGDSVILNAANALGAFGSKTVGTAKPVGVNGLTISGLDAGNYSLVQPGTSANVTAKGLTVSGITANNKTYDANTSAILNTGTGIVVGVVSGDSVTLNAAAGSGVFANPNTGVGKNVTVSGLSIGGGDAGNYNLAQPAAVANINSVELIVSADDKSRAYGVSNPLFTASYAGFVSGEDLNVLTGTPALTSSAGQNSPIGSYPIQIAGGNLASLNYSFNFTNGALAVTPHAITVTAADQSRTYGAANPVLNGTLTGVMNGDNISASYSTPADPHSSVGRYNIVPALNDPAGILTNYSVTMNNGTLTVTSAPLTVAANNATRGYGEPNPNFTVNIWGYVNGDNVSELGGTLTFSTVAQSNSVPGSYSIVPSGLVSTDYSITFSNGTLAVTTSNQAPGLNAIADAVIRPGEFVTLTLHGSDPNGDALAFSLDPGAPAGAWIATVVKTYPVPVTNLMFCWRPTRDQASTTNLITVRATDNGGPPMSAAQTFAIIVLDYLELTVGSTNVQSGQSVAIPIILASSDGATNLAFNLEWPSAWLANAALSVTAPGIASASLQDEGTNLAFSFKTAPGQALQGTQQIAQLTFAAITNAYSAFLSLPISTPSAAKPDGSPYTNYVGSAAQVVVIEEQPLLYGFLTNSGRELTLYGKLGVGYQLEYATDLASPASWNPLWNYVQTTGAITIGVGSANPTVFYRIFEP